MSTLLVEQEAAETANAAALKVWLRETGKDTIVLMMKGKLANLVIVVKNDIPWVQTRFKIKVKQYWGAAELSVVLASTCL